MKPCHSVFFDPSGRRKWVVFSLASVALIGTGLGAFSFIWAIANPPVLPPLPPAIEPLNEEQPITAPAPAEKQAVTLAPAGFPFDFKPPSHASRGWISAAFYSSAPGRLDSLREHAAAITHLLPVWLHLDKSGKALDYADWDAADPETVQALEIARQNEMQVLPVLNNAEGSKFDPVRLHILLNSASKQKILGLEIRDWLLKENFSGLNLDFENLPPEDADRLPIFVAQLSQLLHEAGLSLTLDIAADQSGSPQFAPMVAAADFAVLMAYDEHANSGNVGPIASINWTTDAIRRALRAAQPEKIVLGLGTYGYDWNGSELYSELTYAGAMHVARTHSPPGGAETLLHLDAASLNPYFSYVDEASGQQHQVWYQDAISAHNACLMARRTGLAGSALWEIGGEDPGIWDVLGAKTPPAEKLQAALRSVTLDSDIQYDGKGELLQVISQPRAGERSVHFNQTSGMITDTHYQHLPWGNVVQRDGLHPGWIALTFDDGPNPRFTPQVIDVLQENGVPGTFFLIGQNAADHPDLVRRLWNLGYEIGNHTFTHPDLSKVGDLREATELNSTQRTLESILHRSTLLFRAPYYVETEPELEDLNFLSKATDLGYITVGAGVDPNDWNPIYLTKTGRTTPHTARIIAGQILQQVHAGAGSTILLHDGGGNDRSQTVGALRLVIPQLKKEGYQFVTVSQLAGTTRDALMPKVGAGQSLLLRLYHWDLWGAAWLGAILQMIVLVAMAIGIARILGITTLALVAHRRKQLSPVRFDHQPTVTVLVPAYNESAVISRSLNALLESDYPYFDVLVLDDGSGDDTAEVVEREFGWRPNIRVLRLENGGKASALNRGAAEARGEILVCMDADTIFAADALSHLVQPFRDPQVGAVAGNIKVGNRTRLLTRMQATEYITSQNLDRLAYSLLGAITLVPGAIGAFRRCALEEVGGYELDTLAEDFDLTCRLRGAGWKIEVEQRALAYTEAPEDVAAFLKQRTRWSFGTLQTLWKNRRSLFRHGGYGWIGLPVRLWEFFFYSVAPLLYLKGLFVIGLALYGWIEQMTTDGVIHKFSDADAQVEQIVLWFCLLFTVEVIQSLVAVHIDGEDWRLLRSLPFQRLYFRQLIYLTLWKAWFRALCGSAAGWGILRRTATTLQVSAPLSAANR